MTHSQNPSKTKENISIKPFAWEDWYAMWRLVGYHLTEAGIVLDGVQGPPDFNLPYDESNPDYPEMDMERIDQSYLKGRGNFWLAWVADQPVGHVGAQDFGNFVELRRMYVRQEYRRRGIGTLLVKALIEHCIAKNVGIIELWTNGDGPGRPLYESLGFFRIEPAGGEPEYDKRARYEIRMRRDLTNEI